MLVAEKKNIYPVLGILLGFFLIIFGTFGIFLLFWEVLSEEMLLFTVFAIGITGAFILSINLTIVRIREMAKRLDKAAQLMNPKTKIVGMGVIVQIKPYYIVRFEGYYLNVLRMQETTDYSPSVYRKMVGPKLPSILPLKCPVITEFQRYKLRKCEGIAHIYDIEEDRWVSGHTIMYSIFCFTKPMSDLLQPDVFQNLLYTLTQFE
ncbi:MAG: hypothetical protein JW776_02410 [Candidatus Lokiarchaeota archaeon]|nr:hypothetical protein [Candidatus Lokiarchaeota archaeon]